MQFTSFVLLATSAVANSRIINVPSANIAVADEVKNAHPELWAAFQTSEVYSIDNSAGNSAARRQDVPDDGTPDPNRPVVTPENIFVLQCDLAAFQENEDGSGCLSFGAAPGDCVNYSSFNKTQAFLDQYENKTSSLSTNTGGLCQFYKFIDCNNKGDDRGVSLSYNYNLAEVTEDYDGDYDNQISSWRC